MQRHFSWNAGFNSNLILARIRSTRRVERGRCSFSPAQEYDFWMTVLKSAVRCDALAKSSKASCICATVSNASVSLKDPAEFLAGCDSAFRRISNRPTSEFIFVTTVTYSGPKLLGRVSDAGVRLDWQPNMRGAFARRALAERAKLSKTTASYVVSVDDEKLSILLAQVAAYDVFDAYRKANDSVDRLRGMLNLLVNSTNVLSPFGRLARPHAVNRFRRGPFHTLHKPDGSLATEMFWYEPRWEHHHATVKFTGGPEGFNSKFRGWWKRLQQHNLREFTSGAVLRYCRALDIHEPDAALLGIWQVLELITGTDKYDQLIDRITRLFKDHEDAREVANHLRIRRNQTVHSAHDLGEEAYVILHQAERLAGQGVFFCLMNGRDFRSENELHRFLDFPMDEEKLRRQRELIGKFLRYRKWP